MSRIGIDLGAMECGIAALDSAGNPQMIRDLEDARETLAAVAYVEPEGDVILGITAYEMMALDSERHIRFVRNYLGKHEPAPWTIDDKAYSAEEITAMFLERLKQNALYEGHTMNRVVVAIPVYFGMEETAAVMQALKQAGLENFLFCSEPVAIARSYFHHREPREQNILLFDMGATLDVTALRWQPDPEDQLNGIRILSTAGNDRLGGQAWSDALFNHILELCIEENGLDYDEIDDEDRYIICAQAEKVKKMLSIRETARVKFRVHGNPVSVTVTREEFESLTEHLLSKAMEAVDTVLAQHKAPIDQVLLTGGCAYMPMIRQALEAKFPGKVMIHEPATAVAKGAALIAGTLQ